MRHKSVAPGVFFLLLPLLFPAALAADDTNYQNFLMGDRAAGMGGAVAATTADLDACYYNPAGLARVAGSRIALSVSLYGIQGIRIADGLGKGENFKAREFESIPSTFGSILKVSDGLVLAFSVFNSDKIDLNVRHSFESRPDTPGTVRSDYYSATFDDNTLWIGPSAGWRAGERLSLGAGVYLIYRSAVNKQEWAYLYTTTAAAEVEKVLTRIYSIDFHN